MARASTWICEVRGPRPVPQVLLTVAILLSFTDTFRFGDRWDVVDLFAGHARIARMARQCGMSACAHDYEYGGHKRVFDINSPSGFLIPGTKAKSCD